MEKYEPPLIVADFGTAATFDVVSADGHFIGGVIAPGPGLIAGSMADHTARLPRISLKGCVPRMGRGTRSAMRIGLAVGYAGMTNAIVAHLKSYPGMRHAMLCATGGYAEWVVKQTGLPWKMDSLLTMRGLGRICALNTTPK
jgi:type III pantothenate kinase